MRLNNEKKLQQQQHQVKSGSHPKGPSGLGCCSDVLPPFSISNQLLESNSVSPYGNAIQTSSFQILFYIVHPSLLWAPNRSFSCWLPIMNYGWPPLFAHSRDMSIPSHSHCVQEEDQIWPKNARNKLTTLYSA